jgi:hypothetical protein
MNGYATLSADQIRIFQKKCKEREANRPEPRGPVGFTPRYSFPFLGQVCLGNNVDGGWKGGCWLVMFYPY